MIDDCDLSQSSEDESMKLDKIPNKAISNPTQQIIIISDSNESGDNESTNAGKNTKKVSLKRQIPTDYTHEEPCCSTSIKKIKMKHYSDFDLTGSTCDESTSAEQNTTRVASNFKKTQTQKRVAGQAYTGFEVDKLSKKIKKKERPARIMGPYCECYKKKKQITSCNIFTQQQRQKVHDYFYSLSANDQDKYLHSFVKRVDSTKILYEEQFEYNLPIGERNVQVCRKMFLNTFSLDDKTFRRRIHIPVNRKRQLPVETTKSIYLKQWFADQPKQDSHYCRASTSNIYLTEVFKTKIEVYKQYQADALKAGKGFFKISKFYDEMTKNRIKVHEPLKDMCNICVQYKIKAITEPEMVAHRLKIDENYAHRTELVKLAKEGKIMLLQVDQEKSQMLPKVSAVSAAYKSKMGLHNFTVLDVTSKKPTCYWFSQVDAGQTASTYCSIMDFHLRQIIEEMTNKIPIIIISDGCCAQNRCKYLSNCYACISKEENIELSQFFWEPGHSKMEVDSIHSVLESKFKRYPDIYTKEQYIKLADEAKITPPLIKNVSLDFTFFKDYSEMPILANIRPEGHNVNDLRLIKYTPNNVLYKLSHDPNEEYQMFQCLNFDENVVRPRLYNNPPKISKALGKHIEQLIQFIPEELHPFYNTVISLSQVSDE